jgi:hypothetical protein
MKRLSKRERHNWLLVYMLDEPGWLDVLNSYLVDDYQEGTGVSVDVMPYGANKCRQLGVDLAELASLGYLTRSGMAGMGFPRWVWSYRLSDQGRMRAELAKADAQTQASH